MFYHHTINSWGINEKLRYHVSELFSPKSDNSFANVTVVSQKLIIINQDEEITESKDGSVVWGVRQEVWGIDEETR